MSEREKETRARRLHECDVDEEQDGADVDVAAFEAQDRTRMCWYRERGVAMARTRDLSAKLICWCQDK